MSLMNWCPVHLNSHNIGYFIYIRILGKQYLLQMHHCNILASENIFKIGKYYY